MMPSSTIVYFKHGIGNLVMMSPAIRALASMDPSGKVDICMSSTWQDSRRQAFDDIFANWKLIGKVVNYPVDKLRQDYTRWFYTGHSEASDALDIFRRKAELSEGIPDWRAEWTHETMYYMRLVYKMGYDGPVPEQDFPIVPYNLPEHRHPVVVLCNGSYDTRMKSGKQWRGFPKLASAIRGWCNGTIVKVGWGDELRDVEADIDLVGKLPITQTASVISSSDLFVTADTGLMHVGDALGVKMLVLFGGSLVSKNGPLNTRARVLSKRMPCQPCQKAGPFYDCATYNCLETLTVGDVMNHVRSLL